MQRASSPSVLFKSWLLVWKHRFCCFSTQMYVLGNQPFNLPVHAATGTIDTAVGCIRQGVKLTSFWSKLYTECEFSFLSLVCKLANCWDVKCVSGWESLSSFMHFRHGPLATNILTSKEMWQLWNHQTHFSISDASNDVIFFWSLSKWLFLVTSAFVKNFCFGF